MKKILLLMVLMATPAQAGSITISITTTTAQGGVAPGTVTYTQTFTDSGLINQFGNWLINNPSYCAPAASGQTLTPCALNGANLNTAFQAWAAAFVLGTQNAVTNSLVVSAESAAAASIQPVR